MDILEAIQERRSTRAFLAKTVERETIERLLSFATQAPSAINYFVLAAHALGLGTCPIGLITAFDDDIKELLSIPEEKQVVIGIAVGHRDPDAPINKTRSERVPLSEVVKWRE